VTIHLSLANPSHPRCAGYYAQISGPPKGAKYVLACGDEVDVCGEFWNPAAIHVTKKTVVWCYKKEGVSMPECIYWP